MRLLLVEDDVGSAELVAAGLADSGHEVVQVASAEGALQRIREQSFDALIVDRMLPGMDGIGLIAGLRAEGYRVPVLIVSALGAVDDRVMGLRAGGDDYLVKPYHLSELQARLEALERRARETVGARLQVGALELDLLRREVRCADRRVDLTPREFRLLEVLMRSAGAVVTRKMLLEQVWGYHFDPQTNVIDVHVSRLRQAIGDDPHAPVLNTVRGAGYILAPRSTNE